MKTTHIKSLAVILALVVLAPGCKMHTMYDLVACLKASGSTSGIMPYAKQMQSVGRYSHNIAGFGVDSKTHTWRSDAFFGTRYHIAMSIEVELSSDHSHITRVLGKPQFVLWEYEQSKQNSDSWRAAAQKSFDVSQWNDVVKANGDVQKILDVFGMQANTSELKVFQEIREASTLPAKWRVSF